MALLVCRTLPACLPFTTYRSKHRWRSTACMACPRLTFFTSSSVWTGKAQFWTSPRGACLSREFRCQASFEDLEEADSAVLVVGGGRLGMETVRALVDADLLVAAYQREERFDIPEAFHDDIEEMGWDMIDVATIQKVLESAPFEAVVCTVGGEITQPDSDKNVPIKLVNAAKTLGVTRFILVSSVRDRLKALHEKSVEEVAEEAVKSSKLNYTIIRPGELLTAPPTGNGILTEKSGIDGIISRADVAALILEVLFNEKSYGKTLTAIDQDKLLPPTASLDGVELLSL